MKHISQIAQDAREANININTFEYSEIMEYANALLNMGKRAPMIAIDEKLVESMHATMDFLEVLRRSRGLGYEQDIPSLDISGGMNSDQWKSNQEFNMPLSTSAKLEDGTIVEVTTCMPHAWYTESKAIIEDHDLHHNREHIVERTSTKGKVKTKTVPKNNAGRGGSDDRIWKRSEPPIGEFLPKVRITTPMRRAYKAMVSEYRKNGADIRTQCPMQLRREFLFMLDKMYGAKQVEKKKLANTLSRFK